MASHHSTTINFIHGRPASGKDTISELLAKQTPRSTIISGVYRSAFTKRGMYAKYHDSVAPHIKPLGEGIDIPGETVLNLLQDIVKEEGERGNTTLFICGLLRTLSHAQAVDGWLSHEASIHSRHIYLATPEGRALRQAEQRIIKDRTDRLPRIDDVPELMAARLARFRNNSLPMLKQLHEEGKLTVVRADRPPDEVSRELRAILWPQPSEDTEGFFPSSPGMRR